jgi:SAM-dependent methyltransferase
VKLAPLRLLPRDNNAHYQPLMLRELPARCDRILDVGCGTGQFAVLLAERADHVDALDRSPVMIRAARARVPANVTCIETDLLRGRVPPEHYDAITSISTLHHMVLAEALPRLSSALRPGGVLVATALVHSDWPRELPIDLVGAVAQGVHGLILAGTRLIHGRPIHGSRGGSALDGSALDGSALDGSALDGSALDGRDRVDPDALMPMVEPRLTTREVRSEASVLLPGARVRRLLLWRYLLVWHKPGEPAVS